MPPRKPGLAGAAPIWEACDAVCTAARSAPAPASAQQQSLSRAPAVEAESSARHPLPLSDAACLSRCSLQTTHELPGASHQYQGGCPLGTECAASRLDSRTTPSQEAVCPDTRAASGLECLNVCTREPRPPTHSPPRPRSCMSPGRSPETQSNFESRTKASVERLRTWAGGHCAGWTLAGTPPAPGAGLPTLSQAASR